MGELIDFVAILKAHKLKQWRIQAKEVIENNTIPEISEWGCQPHQVNTFINPKQDTVIGKQQEFSFIVRNNCVYYYQMTLKELALGIQFGTLPEPTHTYDHSESQNSFGVPQ